MRGILILLGAALSFNMAARDSSSYLSAQLPAQWGADTVSADSGLAPGGVPIDDPLLDTLIALGRTNNYDIAAAARRIEVARAAVASARSAYYPQFGISAGWERDRISGRVDSRSGRASVTSAFAATATVSWEIDVFGKIRRQVKEAKASVNVSAAEYEAALVSLDAEIATTYIGLLVDKAQLAVANRHAVEQKHILDITETRHRTGLVSKLDVAQARTLYYSTVAQVPMLEASIEAAYNGIAVLLGTDRSELPAALFADRSVPEVFSLPPMGTPLDLLRRRPDIVEAERNIDVAAAALGIARSQYLPSLTLQASAGTQAHNFGDLFSAPSFTYTVAPTLSWTVFDGFARRAANISARQSLEIAVDNYNFTVLTAVEEVRNAMANYMAALKYLDRLEKVLENSAESVTLSLDQYKQGLGDFYNVVEAELGYLTYQNTCEEVRGKALAALVTLYKSLGGGYADR